MQNLVWKVVLIVAVLGLCLWAVYPPEQKIRLGKDLRGGTSLIYHVAIPDDVPAAEREAILTQTIQVLKDRVNPQGVLDISMLPLGADRIEIIMPLPNDEMKALRKQYHDVLEDLEASALVPAHELDAALLAETAVQRFGGEGTTPRAQTIADLQKAHDDVRAARAGLDGATAASAPPEEISRLEQALADATFTFQTLRDAVLRSSLDETRVVRTLNLPSKADSRSAAATGGVSAREAALTTLKAEFPHLADKLDQTVAAFDAYQSKRTTLDDPEDLMRLLRGAGVLDFRIAVRPSDPQGIDIAGLRKQLADVGPARTDSSVARWFPINDLKQWYKSPNELISLETDPESYFSSRYGLAAAGHEGKFYLLLFTTREKSMTHETDAQWTVNSTGRTQDELGRPAVSFGLDAAGGSMMSRLTGPHVGQPMAIVLDGQVYSAPTLNSAIGNSGIIQGEFNQAELEYLTRVLAAGALSARLSEQPIAINTLGPTIGYDNLQRGLGACLWSIIAVAIFMLIYYFQAGMVANVAVAANALFVFGVMAIMNSSFTLPGLAGVALTIGMAVDANILIYERIREELTAGEKNLKIAIQQGYNKALSTILDANITNLIVCVVLLNTATTEVKGFATTLTIGIAGTLFTALFMTRQIYLIGTDIFGWKRMPMLATTVPAVQRFLSPNVDWIGMRKVFVPLSTVLVLGSWVLIGMRGVTMFDTEFRGGLTATMHTAADENGDRLKLKHLDVEQRIHAIGQKAEQLPPSDNREVLREMRNAEVLTVGETDLVDGQLVATSFQVKVALPANIKETASFKDSIIDAIIDEMGPQLDVIPPLEFAGHQDSGHTNYTFPIATDDLGSVIKRPQHRHGVASYKGGVAIVIDQLNPPATTKEIEDRLARMRSQPDFSDTSGRSVEVVGLTPAQTGSGSRTFESVAVLVADSAIDYTKVDFETWDSRLAAREWELISTALARPATFDQVSEFSSAVASTLRAGAVVAVSLSLICILIYIWIRFGSLRYSFGAIAALVHDVSIGLGLLAFSQLIGESAFGKALLLEPFHIDMGVVAAILTLIGYSLNDTIVVLDRIRENRGKLAIPTAETVNKSINQTFSRTTLTGVTTVISLLILYIEGGTGIRAFSFVMLTGLIIGTYSSVAIAAPLVFKGHSGKTPPPKEQSFEARMNETVAATV